MEHLSTELISGIYVRLLSGGELCNQPRRLHSEHWNRAGYWDRYLSYKVPNGLLTSVDIDRSCADNLKACLQNERNGNPVRVICADAITYDFGTTFDLVTMVGSAVEESGSELSIISKAFSLVKNGGALYLQFWHNKSGFDIDQWARGNNASIVAHLIDDTYNIHCEYYKIMRAEKN